MEAVLSLGVWSWSLRFRARLVSGQCLAASVCRYVRWVGTLHCRPVCSPAKVPHWCWHWCPLRGLPHFFRAHRRLLALRLGWQCRPFGFIICRSRCPSGVALRHGRRLGSAFRVRGLWGARRGGGACRVRAGAEPGAGQPGDDGSAGRAVGPVGGAWCRWGAGLSCVVAGRSSAPDVAGAWGIRPSVGPWVWGCTVSEGRAAVVSVGIAVCACVGGPSGGSMLGPLQARQVCHGAGGAPGGPVVLPTGWLPAVDRARTRRVVLGVAGFLWGSGPVP